MITKFTCKLYCNPPERLKDKKIVQCLEFQLDDMKEYFYVDNWHEIDHWIDYIGLQQAYRKDITACMVLVQDGELIDMWLSESSRPYDLYDGYYHSLKYYLR